MFHSQLNYWRADGRTWKCGSGCTTLSSVVLFILIPPPASCPGRCLSQTPVLHVRDTLSLTDTTQWCTHFAGAKADIWTTGTKVKHGSALIHAGLQCGECTFWNKFWVFFCQNKIDRIPQQSSWQLKGLQESSHLSFCCNTGFHHCLGCHININWKCLLPYSNLRQTCF